MNFAGASYTDESGSRARTVPLHVLQASLEAEVTRERVATFALSTITTTGRIDRQSYGSRKGSPAVYCFYSEAGNRYVNLNLWFPRGETSSSVSIQREKLT